MLLQIKCPANLAPRRWILPTPTPNTEPDPKTSLRMQLRDVRMGDVFPAAKRIISVANLDGEVLDLRQFLTETLGVLA